MTHADWIKVLQAACRRDGQAATAKRLGYSPAVVNQAIKGTYKGNLKRLEQAVRGALLGETVTCPVLGDIPGHQCLEHQHRKFAATNQVRVRLFKACHGGCKHSWHNKAKREESTC